MATLAALGCFALSTNWLVSLLRPELAVDPKPYVELVQPGLQRTLNFTKGHNVSGSSPTLRRRRHFYSFGNNHVRDAVRVVSGQAESLDVFHGVHRFESLPEELLANQKWRRHLESTRGYGFWFWKPALFNLLVKQADFEDGDTVAYIDGGSGIGRESRRTWIQLLGMVEDEIADMVTKQLPIEYPEHNWTKGDIYGRFNRSWNDVSFGTAGQVVANWWIVQVNPQTRRFMQEWEELVSDFHLLSDEPDAMKNPYLVENRHDQSFFSMLAKSNAPWILPMLENIADLANWTYIRTTAPAFEGRRHEDFGIDGLKIVIFQERTPEWTWGRDPRHFFHEPQ